MCPKRAVLGGASLRMASGALYYSRSNPMLHVHKLNFNIHEIPVEIASPWQNKHGDYVCVLLRVECLG